MDIRVVSVCMRNWFVNVLVSVRHCKIDSLCVFVLMVFIMNVAVGMLKSNVRVLMFVLLHQVKRHAGAHECGSQKEDHSDGFM